MAPWVLFLNLLHSAEVLQTRKMAQPTFIKLFTFYFTEVDDGCYVAMYPYDSNEPGDLSFVAGEAIMVIKKEGDWWTGTIGLRSGVFPSNYVQKAESQYEADANSEVEGINNRAEQSAVAKSPASNSLNQSGSQKRSSTAPIDGDNDVITFLFKIIIF